MRIAPQKPVHFSILFSARRIRAFIAFWCRLDRRTRGTATRHAVRTLLCSPSRLSHHPRVPLKHLRREKIAKGSVRFGLGHEVQKRVGIAEKGALDAAIQFVPQQALNVAGLKDGLERLILFKFPFDGMNHPVSFLKLNAIVLVQFFDYGDELFLFFLSVTIMAIP